MVQRIGDVSCHVSEKKVVILILVVVPVFMIHRVLDDKTRILFYDGTLVSSQIC